MNSSEFKNAWLGNGFNPQIEDWLEFDLTQIKQSSVNQQTKLFLQSGFPDNAAPFLSFDFLRNKQFKALSELFPKAFLSEKLKSIWALGSDGGGDLIAIDASNGDTIVLLDHEQNFELIGVINESIEEFAHCLLLYRNFVYDVLIKNGRDAYLDQNYTKEQLADLIKGFNEVNSNILKRPGFWKGQISSL